MWKTLYNTKLMRSGGLKILNYYQGNHFTKVQCGVILVREKNGNPNIINILLSELGYCIWHISLILLCYSDNWILYLLLKYHFYAGGILNTSLYYFSKDINIWQLHLQKTNNTNIFNLNWNHLSYNFGMQKLFIHAKY